MKLQLSEKMLREIRELTEDQFNLYIKYAQSCQSYGIIFAENAHSGKCNVVKFSDEGIHIYKKVKVSTHKISDCLDGWSTYNGVGDSHTECEVMRLERNSGTTYHVKFHTVSISEFLSNFNPIHQTKYFESNQDYCNFSSNLVNSLLSFSDDECTVIVTKGSYRVFRDVIPLSHKQYEALLTNMISYMGEINLALRLREKETDEDVYTLQTEVDSVSLSLSLSDRQIRQSIAKKNCWKDYHPNWPNNTFAISLHIKK